MWAPGMGELLIIMVVVLLIFGTSRLKNIGKDLGGAISEFKSTMKPEESKDQDDKAAAAPDVQQEKQEEAPGAAADVTRPMPGE